MTRSERLNQELIFLSYRATFHVNDLMTTFNISKRTALRDIASLEQLGLAFYVEPGRYGGYRLTKRQLWVPVLLNLPEINAIFFALKALSLLSATPFEKSYQTIYQKLMAALPLTEQQKVGRLQEVVNYYTIPNLDGPQFLSQLLTAILNEQVVALTLTDSPHPDQFQVYDLLYRHGIWFFSGYNLAREQWGIYRCDLITAISVAKQAAPYDHTQLKQLQQAYDAQHHDVPFECSLTPLGRELVQKNNYPNMHLKRRANQDYLYGGYNRDEYDYMIQYLLGLGTNVKILYPKELQTGYLKELQKLMALYSDSSDSWTIRCLKNGMSIRLIPFYYAVI